MLALAAAFLSSALAEVPDCDPDASKLPRGEHHLAMVGPDGALRYRERVTLTDTPEGLVADGEEEIVILGQPMVTAWTARVGPRMELLSTTRTEPDRVAPLDDMFDAIAARVGMDPEGKGRLLRQGWVWSDGAVHIERTFEHAVEAYDARGAVPRGSAGLIALAGSALPVGTLCRWSTPTFDQAHPWNNVILSVGPAQAGDVRVRLDPESGAVRALDVHRFGQAPLSETMLAQLRVCADATCAELVKPYDVADAIKDATVAFFDVIHGRRGVAEAPDLADWDVLANELHAPGTGTGAERLVAKYGGPPEPATLVAMVRAMIRQDALVASMSRTQDEATVSMASMPLTLQLVLGPHGWRVTHAAEGRRAALTPDDPAAPVADAPVLGGVVSGDLPAVAPNVHPTAVTWVRPVRPKYPSSQLGLDLPEVRCVVELFVTARGAVHVGHFLECPEPFRASVLTAAGEAKARPVLVDGTPTQVRTKLLIRFVEE